MQKGLLAFAVVVLACLGAEPSEAASYPRIDIDGGPNSTASNYTAWILGNDLVHPQDRVATHVFTNFSSGNITCTVAQTFPTNVDSTVYLKGSWLNKNGQGKYNLAFDGVWVHWKDDSLVVDRPNTNGAISLTVSGLAAGPHTFTTYHNRVWTNLSFGTMSACNITVDSNLLATVTPSFVATNDNDCGFAFFSVNAVAGQPIVINFDPDHTGLLDNVILNGFEIDRPTAPSLTAVALAPGDGEEHVFANNDDAVPGSAGTGFTTLQWLPAQAAVSHDVYFGTNDAAVDTATHASPEFKGNQTTNVWNATNLNSALTYYWRVDEIDSTNGVIKGFVWRFRTRHLAFPGAEGYGRFARGGRGGVVVEVTNLLDYDTNEVVIAGSYRAAVEATGPRTIVFRVSGFIPLKRPCTINSANGYVTIAGQTAPGDGICLGNYRAGMGSCNDVIMRFIRLRVGDFCKQSMDGIGNGNSDNTIIDHCSISWTIDEGTSSRSGHNFTFQRNIISEALNNSYHYDDNNQSCTNCYQRHSFAGSISGGIGSYHHNLLAHNAGRNWSLAGGLTPGGKYDGYIDIRNNVVYNWQNRTTDGGAKQVNYVANYYEPGPVTALFKLMKPDSGSAADRQQYYVTNNILEGYYYETNNWAGIQVQGATEADVRVDTPFFPDYVTTHSVHDAYKNVLSDVGANQPREDLIDLRAISNTIDKTYTFIGSKDGLHGIIDSQDDVGGYPTNSYATFNVETDTDHDGMPDWWESIHGTNTNSPSGDFSDSNADPDGDGYSNLEDYLNWLAAPHGTCMQDTYLDVDLSQLTIGFTNQPIYSVFTATSGTVALLGDGKTAHFAPTTGFAGLGSFRFAVVDADGSALTNAVGVRVTPSGAPPLTPFEQWQADYFGSTTNAAADPNFDPDGDGMSNTNEFLSGTTPTNNLSSLRIISAVRQSNDVTITWTTAGGRTNAVQATAGDASGSYTTNNFLDITTAPHTIISGSGDATTNYVDEGGGTNTPSRFYRIRLVP